MTYNVEFAKAKTLEYVMVYTVVSYIATNNVSSSLYPIVMMETSPYPRKEKKNLPTY